MLLNNHPSISYISWIGLVIIDGDNTYIIEDNKTCEKYIYWERDNNPYVLKTSNEWIETTTNRLMIYINEFGEATEVPQDTINFYYTDKGSGGGGGIVTGELLGKFEEINGKFFIVNESINGINIALGETNEVNNIQNQNITKIEKSVKGINETISSNQTTYESDKEATKLRESVSSSIIDLMTMLKKYEDVVYEVSDDLVVTYEEQQLITEQQNILKSQQDIIQTYHNTLILKLKDNQQAIDSINNSKSIMDTAIINLNNGVNTAISDSQISVNDVTVITNLFATASLKANDYSKIINENFVLGVGGSVVNSVFESNKTSTEFSQKISNIVEDIDGETGLKVKLEDNYTLINQTANDIKLNYVKFDQTTAQLMLGDGFIKLDAGKVFMSGTLTWDSLDDEAKVNLKGEKGDNGTAEYIMIVGDQLFKYNADLTPSTENVLLTIQTSNIKTPKYKWFYKNISNSEWIDMNTTTTYYRLFHNDSIWNGYDTISFRVECTSYEGNIYYDEFTVTKLYDGVNGIDGVNGVNAKYIIVNGEKVFKYGSPTEIPVPSEIVLEATKFNFTDNCKWQYKNHNGAWVDYLINGEIVTSTVCTVRYNFTPFININSITFRYVRISDESVYDTITLTKMVNGVNGENGKDSYTVILTNENHSFPCENNGDITVSTTATTKVVAYKGVNKVIPTIGSITSPNGLTINVDVDTIKFTTVVGNDLANEGSVDIPIIIDGVELIKSFSWSKARKGDAGLDSSYVRVSGEQIFKYADNLQGIPTPEKIMLTGEKFNITSNDCRWYYKLPSSNSWTEITTARGSMTYEVDPKNTILFSGNTNVSIKFEIDLDSDIITIAKVSDGEDGIDGIYINLSNENHTIPCDSEGNYEVSELSKAFTTIKAYKGTKEVAFSLTKTDNGCTSVYNTAEKTLTITSLTEKSASVIFSVMVEGKIFEKVMTISKAYQGMKGNDGTGIQVLGKFDSIEQLPSTAKPGDAYIVKGLIYVWSANTNSWSDGVPFKGEQGIPGKDGINGETTYFHIKYSDDGKTFTANNGTTPGKWIGQYTDFIAEHSAVFSDYTWIKIVGEDGDNGIVASLTNEAHVVPCDWDGNNGDYLGCDTQISLSYDGEVITNNVTYSHVKSEGVVGTWSGANGKFIVTNLTSDTGYVDLKAIYNNVTYTKRFTISKNKHGADSYTISITNESHIFQSDYYGNIDNELTTATEIKAFKEGNPIPVTIGTLPTVDGLTLSKNGSIITIKANIGTELADSGTFNIPITAGKITVTKTFSWSKVRAGLNSKFITVSGENIFTYTTVVETIRDVNDPSIINTNEITTVTPQTITLTAIKHNMDDSCRWEFRRSGENTWATITHATDVNYVLSHDDSVIFNSDTVKSVTLRYISNIDETIYDEITIIKLSNGVDGTNSYTVTSSNENHSFICDRDGNIITAQNTQTEIKAYYGIAPSIVIIGTLPTVNGLTLSKNDSIINITANTGNALATSGTFDIPITVDGIPFTKKFSWTKLKQGSNGANASYIEVNGEQIFKYANNFTGTPTPSSITLTATKFNLTQACKWQYKNSSGVWVDYLVNGVVQTGLTLSIAHNISIFANVKILSFRYISISNTNIYDQITLSKISDGQDGLDSYSVNLSNENHSFMSDYNGNIINNQTTTVEVIAMKGLDPITPIIGDIKNTNGLTIVKNGTIITIKANKGTALADKGEIEIPITVGVAHFTKIFSFTKVKCGQNGADGYTVLLTNDFHSFVCESNGNIPVASTVTTEFKVYKGTNELYPMLGDLPTVNGLTLGKSSNNKVSIKANTGAVLANSGSFDIVGYVPYKNMVLNPSFVYGTKNWSLSVASSFDATVKHNNNPSIKISSSGQTVDVWRNVLQYIFKEYKANTKYTISCWYYCADKNTFDSDFAIEVKGIRSGASTSSAIGAIVVSKNDLKVGQWTRVSKTISQTVDFSDVCVSAWVQRNGTIWVTDFQVEEGDVLTDCEDTAISFSKTFSWSKTFKGQDGVDGSNANIPSWIEEWDSGKTTINSSTVLSPKLFAGSVTNGIPTGVAIGKNVFGTTGDYANITGIAGYNNGVRNYYFTQDGRVYIGNNDYNLNWNGSNLTLNVAMLKINSKDVLTGEQTQSKIEQSSKVIMNEVSNLQGDLAKTSTTANKIDWLVASGSSSSNMVLTDSLYKLVSKNITLNATQINIGNFENYAVLSMNATFTGKSGGEVRGYTVSSVTGSEAYNHSTFTNKLYDVLPGSEFRIKLYSKCTSDSGTLMIVGCWRKSDGTILSTVSIPIEHITANTWIDTNKSMVVPNRPSNASYFSIKLHVKEGQIKRFYIDSLNIRSMYNASDINIEGYISANGNFKVDTAGNLSCKNAKLSGTIEASTINGSTINSKGSDGDFTTVQGGYIECTGTTTRYWLGKNLGNQTIKLKSENGKFRARNEALNHSVYFSDQGLSTTHDGNRDSSGIIDFHNDWYNTGYNGLTMYSNSNVGLISKTASIMISPEWDNAGNNTFSFQVANSSNTSETDGIIYYGSHKNGYSTMLRLGKDPNNPCLQVLGRSYNDTAIIKSHLMQTSSISTYKVTGVEKINNNYWTSGTLTMNKSSQGTQGGTQTYLSGTVVSATTFYQNGSKVSTSDIILKDNIKKFEGSALDIIDRTDVYTFNRINEKNNITEIGFIAQRMPDEFIYQKGRFTEKELEGLTVEEKKALLEKATKEEVLAQEKARYDKIAENTPSFYTLNEEETKRQIEIIGEEVNKDFSITSPVYMLNDNNIIGVMFQSIKELTGKVRELEKRINS